MKKSLLIGVATVALIGVSATLFAQTATGSSVIAEMKAAARSFTLKADLNSGSTANLQSSPVTGKETGDMLTAGEWNRMLELVAQGGGGQSNIIKGTASVGFTNGQPHSTMATVSFGRTCTNPVIIVQSVADSILCGTGASAGNCSNAPGTTSQDLSAYFHTVTNTGFQVFLSGMSGVWVGASSPAFYVNYVVACDEGTGGGGAGGTGSGWVNVPLTDTADYDVSCQYRLTMSFADDVNRKWHNATSATYYISWMSSKYLGLGLYNADQNYYGIPSTTKSQYGYRSPTGVFVQSSNVTVTKLEKKC